MVLGKADVLLEKAAVLLDKIAVLQEATTPLVAELNWSLGVVAWEHDRRLAAIAVLEGSALLQEKWAASGFFCVFLPHSAYV